MYDEPQETGRWVEFDYRIEGTTECWVEFDENTTDALVYYTERIAGGLDGLGLIEAVPVYDPHFEDEKAHYAG